MSCAAAASKLVDFTSEYSELILVAHSMGGLVASKFCAMSSANRAKVCKLITLGTPYNGAPQLLYVAETGDFNALLTDSKVKEIMPNFHCTYQLAPTTQYGTGATQENKSYITKGSVSLSGNAARSFYASRPWATTNGSAKTMYSQATSFHNSLFVSGKHIANNWDLVDTYKIIGYGFDTVTAVVYDSTGGFVKGHKTNNGDGTVPLWSASNNLAVGAATKVYAVNSNHLSLVTNNAAIALIKQFIRQSSSTSYTTALPDGVITDLSTNELGWLNATDNRRLVVTTDVEDELLITTSDGQRLVFNGNSIYDDEGVYWGSVWLLGNGSREYCLRFGNYEIETSANGGTITVAYMDDGFVDANKTYTVGVEQGSVYRFICSNESSFRVVVGEEK